MRYLPWLFAVSLLADSKLGDVSFPVTGSAESRKCFERGVAALHSFWFEEAREQFQRCTAAAPDFAMGYWGEAMTYNHSLWMRVWPEEANAALAKIGNEDKLTPRERGYIAAVRTLFGKGTKLEREIAYTRAMEKLSADYPDDHEAAAFYALSLLGQTRKGDPGYVRQMKAGAIVLDLYARNPNHPGAAHYIIHAFDDPQHAILALPAARRYAQIAPEAHHAKHMPSHIFLQLGMWPEEVASNEASWAASVKWQTSRKLDYDKRDYHSQYWLAYGYLQQGRFAEAWKIYDAKRRDLIEAQGAGEVYRYWADLGAMLVLETGAWDRATTVFDDPVTVRRSAGSEHVHAPPPNDRASAALVRGLAAALQGGDIAPHLDQLAQVKAIMEQRQNRVGAAFAEAQALMIRARAAARAGRFEEALPLMAKATQLEETDGAPDGPPLILKPSHELFGEILLEAGRPADAARQFARALERQPNRSRSLLGAARAAARLNDAATAQGLYRRLAQNWSRADSSLPELAEVRGASQSKASE